VLKNQNLFSDEQVHMGNTPEGFVPNCGSTRMDQQPGGITGANQNGDEVCFLAAHRRFCFYGRRCHLRVQNY